MMKAGKSLQSSPSESKPRQGKILARANTWQSLTSESQNKQVTATANTMDSLQSSLIARSEASETTAKIQVMAPESPPRSIQKGDMSYLEAFEVCGGMTELRRWKEVS